MSRRHLVLFSLLLALFLVGPSAANAAKAVDTSLLNDNAVADSTPRPFKACRPIIRNLTGTSQTVTITICNTSDSTMNVDISGTGLVDIPPGESETLIITLKNGEFLHADMNGTSELLSTVPARLKN